MEGIQKAFRSAMSQDPNGSLSSISSALEKAPIKSSATVSSADQSQLLLTRSSSCTSSIVDKQYHCGLAQSSVPFVLLLEYLLVIH
ncbi:uncharacterized protein LOC107026398 isoform X2 [Solanum pennellii]|uniref:Uncharacterized protein LOC107026398 isoform X2 n=1 Tax=Solanum pennellii TaxID=28526 RepID=A0ABM1VEU2_SOLPN|nr:uncharacterized protein LOC107026398 isoform X2 [Solanum pennellii]